MTVVCRNRSDRFCVPLEEAFGATASSGAMAIQIPRLRGGGARSPPSSSHLGGAGTMASSAWLSHAALPRHANNVSVEHMSAAEAQSFGGRPPVAHDPL